MKVKKDVFVFHPGLQHSYQLAEALYRNGRLIRYVSGVPVSSDSSEWSFIPKLYRGRIKNVTIPRPLRRHPLFWQVAMRIGVKFSSCPRAWQHRIFHAFDEYMAKQIENKGINFIVGFENSSCRTFEAAKRQGIKCILDAPSIHPIAAESLVQFDNGGYGDVIMNRRLKEIELADVVITCSEYARKTYLDNGVPENKVVSLLLGAKPPLITLEKRNNEIPVFLFAGAMSYRKSIDLIFDVFEKLQGKALLKVVGGAENSDWIDRAESLQNVDYIGMLGQKELYFHMAQADCLILPSRFDSFGMVVAESLSVGTPVLVSENVGAKEIIERFPDAGWICKPTIESLEYEVNRLIYNRNLLEIAVPFAIEAGTYFCWDSYYDRVACFFDDYC